MQHQNGGIGGEGEHVAPGDIELLDAETDEAEYRFGQDEAGDGQGGGDDAVGGGLGQYVAGDDVERTAPHRETRILPLAIKSCPECC